MGASRRGPARPRGGHPPAPPTRSFATRTIEARRAAADWAPASLRLGGGSGVAPLPTGTAAPWLGLRDFEPASPAAPRPASRPVRIWAGGNTTCARTEDGAVACWGFRPYLFGRERQSDVPVLVGAPTPFVDVALGDQGYCTLSADEGLRCDGYLVMGGPVARFRSLRLGASFGCATAIRSHPARSWVSSRPSSSASLAPIRARVARTVGCCAGACTAGGLRASRCSRCLSRPWSRAISTDFASSLAAGALSCCRPRAMCGRPFRRATSRSRGLGDASNEERLAPVEVRGLEDAVQIGAGAAHTCARRSNGRVTCWGDPSYGKLGNGTTLASASPVRVRW